MNVSGFYGEQKLCQGNYWYNGCFQSAVFYSGQKMALRAFYFIITLLDYYINKCLWFNDAVLNFNHLLSGTAELVCNWQK